MHVFDRKRLSFHYLKSLFFYIAVGVSSLQGVPAQPVAPHVTPAESFSPQHVTLSLNRGLRCRAVLHNGSDTKAPFSEESAVSAWQARLWDSPKFTTQFESDLRQKFRETPGPADTVSAQLNPSPRTLYIPHSRATPLYG